jgi:hypothetical protein
LRLVIELDGLEKALQQACGVLPHTGAQREARLRLLLHATVLMHQQRLQVLADGGQDVGGGQGC